MFDCQKGAVGVVCALRFNTMRGKVALQTTQAIKAVIAQPFDAETERELLPGSRLVPAEDGGGGLEEPVAVRCKAGRVGALEAEGLIFGEPADVEWPQVGLERVRREIEEASSRTATQVFVAAADHEVGAHCRGIDWKRTDCVVSVDEQASAALVTVCGEVVEVWQEFAGHKEDLGDDDEINTLFDPVEEWGKIELAVGAVDSGELKLDATDSGVLLQ